MCLRNVVKINTEKDIVCYKLFWKDGNRPDKLYSFYRYSPYKLNVTRSTLTKTPRLYRYAGEYCIKESAFHSFANYGEVKEFQKNNFNGGSIIVKCIIPKDSVYIYEGTFEGTKSYASQKLTPVEIIEQSISEN